MSSNKYTNIRLRLARYGSVTDTDCGVSEYSHTYNVYQHAEFKEGFNTPSKQTTIDGIPLDEYLKHMTIDGIPFTDYVENIVDVRLRAILKEMKGTI